MSVQTVYITITCVALLVACVLLALFTYWFHPSKEKTVKEEFLNPDDDSSNTFVLNDPTFEQTCIKSLIKPTDFRMTNIIHYLRMKEKDVDDKIVFLGPCRHRFNYYIVSNRESVDSIKSIPKGSTLYYNAPGDVYIFRSIMSSIYNITPKTHNFKFESIRPSHCGGEEIYYTNDVCNSFDYQSNPLSELLMKTKHSFLLISFNSLYDDHLHKFFFNDNVDTKLFPLHFTHGDLNANETQLQVIDTVYNSDMLLDDLSNMELNHEKIINMYDRVLRFDTLLYTDDINKVNFDRFHNLDMVDEDLIPKYFDLFNICKLPDKLRDIILSLPTYGQESKPVDHDSTRMNDGGNSTFVDSCHPDTSIKNNDGNYNNYVSKHCANGTSMFIDIIWPIRENYDITLSSHDLNTLRIHSETLDTIVPLLGQPSEKIDELESITRFKINVDPEIYSRDVFLNDIYYGIESFEDTDADGNEIAGSLLKNSIPFDFDDTIHEIVEELGEDLDPIDNDGIPKAESGNSFYIMHKTGEDIFASFTDSTDRKRRVKLYQGDRVFLNIDTINYTADRLKLFIIRKMQQEEENYYHGYVVNKTDATEESSKEHLIIKLDNIRNSFEKQEFCFDNSWLSTTDDMEHIKTKGQCESQKGRTWDVKCKYNYECPFFQKNKNYANNFGGCNSDGFCEMPVGINERGFRKYNRDSNYPICYNCPVGVPMKSCCEEQERAVDRYADGKEDPVSKHETNTPVFNKALKSADYMFRDDNSMRINQLHTDNLKICDGSSTNANESKLYINNFN